MSIIKLIAKQLNFTDQHDLPNSKRAWSKNFN